MENKLDAIIDELDKIQNGELKHEDSIFHRPVTPEMEIMINKIIAEKEFRDKNPMTEEEINEWSERCAKEMVEWGTTYDSQFTGYQGNDID